MRKNHRSILSLPTPQMYTTEKDENKIFIEIHSPGIETGIEIFRVYLNLI